MKLFRIALMVSAVFAAAATMRGQIMPMMTVNQPFVATESMSVTKDSATKMTTITVARRSDGSTYQKVGDPKTGQTGVIIITDVAQKRMVVLSEAKRTYLLAPLPWLSGFVDPNGADASTTLVGEAKGTISTLRDGSKVEALGKRTIAGLECLGSLQTYPSTLGFGSDVRTNERWKNPALEMDLERRDHNPARGTDTETKVLEVKMGEPDGKLFEIPKGYTLDPRKIPVPNP